MGKFIVLEGADQAGKTCQSFLLVDRLQGAGYKVKGLKLPDKDNPIYKEAIACLCGMRPDYDHITTELLLAAAMNSYNKKINNWLTECDYVVCDRHYMSGVLYGIARSYLIDPEREQYPYWVDFMFEIYDHVPQADINIYLSVPTKTRHKRKAQEEKDTQELNLELQEIVQRLYEEVDNHRVAKIDGTQDMRTVHETILQTLIERGIVNDFISCTK